MYGVELYAAVRLAVVDEGLSHHEAGRRFGIDRRTVKKMLSYPARSKDVPREGPDDPVRRKNAPPMTPCLFWRAVRAVPSRAGCGEEDAGWRR